MNHQRRRHRILGTPALAALSLLALAAPGCGVEGGKPGDAGKPLVETYDEDFENVPVQARASRTVGPQPGDEAGAGGAAGKSGSGGTAGRGGAGGGTAGAGGGTAGKGGTAGAGGGTAGVGGGTAGGGGVAGKGGAGGGTAGVGGGTAGVGGVAGKGGAGGGTAGVSGASGKGGFGGGTAGGGSPESDDKACSDGIDNDGDGAIDCDDFDCFDDNIFVCGGTGGSAGGPAGSGGAGGGPGGGLLPSALWHFDDCSPITRTLLDSSGNGIHATRTAQAACAEGISGQAIAFDAAGDRVDAENAPPLALDEHLAVAAWINPELTDGNRPVVLKRLQNQTAFSLRVQNNQIQFSVTLDSGQTFTSAAPIAANQWSHVAGLYDGRFVFLFLNGEQVGQVFAEGSIRDVDVPLRIGSTTQTQRFVGRIDEVFVSTEPATPADVQALSCIRQPTSISVDPESAGPVPAGTTVPYNVTVHNNDFGFCGDRPYVLFPNQPEGFSVFPEPGFVEVPSGQSANFTLSVTSFEDAEEQVATIPFSVFDLNTFEENFGQVTYEVAESSGCQVSTARELFIRDLSVVDDPVRALPGAPPGLPNRGAWTFGKLMTDAAPSPEQAPEFVERVFNAWLSDQTVNSFNVPARPAMQSVVLDSWPRLPDGRLDLERAPLQLQAIVNRIDLRDLAQGNAGEGRFVFAVAPNGFPQQFTVILEYKLPATTEADVLDWAQRWHALSQLPFPSPAYNDALQAITDRFAGRNAAPGRPNGSSLSQLRTNEIALFFEWELREFHIAEDGFLHQTPVAVTPARGFDNSDRLARFINQNEAVILTERHTVPDLFEGEPFGAGAIANNIDIWSAPGVSSEARHKFSLNTCNGCHGAETNTGFLHVSPRFPGGQAQLSAFMTGTTAFDPFTGEPRQLNDLGRRRADLRGMVCEPEPEARAAKGVNLRKGISRAHLAKRLSRLSRPRGRALTPRPPRPRFGQPSEGDGGRGVAFGARKGRSLSF
jgi:concanavalin A-like lectin/glucanase superfamily protein